MRLLLFLILFMAQATASAVDLPTVEDTEISARFREYLRSRGEDPGSYGIEVLKLGESERIVLARQTGSVLHADPDRFVQHWDGSIIPLDANSLAAAFSRAFPPAASAEARNKLMLDYVSVLNRGGPPQVINSVKDILKYGSSPLDPDLEGSVTAPFSPTEGVFVRYVYHQLGGLVIRYRFTFKHGLISEVLVTTLATGIGDAKYLE